METDHTPRDHVSIHPGLKKLPIGLDNVFPTTISDLNTFVCKRNREFTPKQLSDSDPIIDFKKCLDPDYIKKVMDYETGHNTFFCPYLLDIPKEMIKFSVGSIVDCYTNENVTVRLKVWFPGLPLAIDPEKETGIIPKIHPCNLFLLVDPKITKKDIDETQSLLYREKFWTYAYMSASDNRIIEFTRVQLDSLFEKGRRNVDMRSGNIIIRKNIPIPLWPPHKYNNANKPRPSKSNINNYKVHSHSCFRTQSRHFRVFRYLYYIIHPNSSSLIQQPTLHKSKLRLQVKRWQKNKKRPNQLRHKKKKWSTPPLKKHSNKKLLIPMKKSR